MKIDIKGPIINDSDQWIYDWFDIPATSPGKVSALIEKAIRNQDNELTIVINSGGGSVYAASEMYTALKSFAGNVKTQIVGLAASAASILAMVGHTEISPLGQLMIHNASTGAHGDYNEMDDTSDFLQKVNKTITNAYRAKTGKSEEELLEMMNNTTWMTAGEAKEMGFVDAIMFESEFGAVANAEQPELVNGIIPKKVIDQLRQQLKQDPINKATNSAEKKGGNKPMDMETLKNDHPELVNQLVQAAAKSERQRIQEIENIAVPGTEEIINKAKFETGISAAETAMEILKNEKARKAEMLNNIQQDANPLNQVENGSLPQKSENIDDYVNTILNNTGLMGGK
ncbi:hypothetical protein SporoP37_15825 [Sporosarcina sp. P37]|uniref:head maturation protease, ClpP-related n=1 Tax=unclassified Sporosarcina TaxID=2647733 RepID=UPI000A17B2FD|nr:MULTISPECIES: head maturation protease, ClpP-related [unclassified Sporosarcina]ARK25995.1 hypothetical protein SporoP37_15825 [Sporosarcina sp. P37]PID19364.1 hypothetical protein CSV62_02350 [Sporosarcina sp. P35]